MAEKSTPWGFFTIENAREFILLQNNDSIDPPVPVPHGKRGKETLPNGSQPPAPTFQGTAKVIAPCSHSFTCPLKKYEFTLFSLTK